MTVEQHTVQEKTQEQKKEHEDAAQAMRDLEGESRRLISTTGAAVRRST